QVSSRICVGNCSGQSFLGQLVFAANEDESHIRLGRVGSQDQPLNQLVWIAFHQVAILEGTGLHLVGVGNYVLRPRSVGAHRHEAPLHSGGETRSSTAAQAGLLHFFLYGLRGHLAQSLAQSLVAAHLLVSTQTERLAVEWNRLREWSLVGHSYLYASSTSSMQSGPRSLCNSLSTSIAGA